MKAPIIVFLALIILFAPKSLIGQGEKLDCLSETKIKMLIDNYWIIQEKQEALFLNLSIDENGYLTSDGIGEWDETECLYSEAGKNVPGTRIKRHRTDKFQLQFGDSGLKIGDQLVTYALEYDLLLNNDQELAAKKTLNKIFLLLQGVRRLDMTANKYMELYYKNCAPEECPDFVADLSGYTGFMLREDTPYAIDMKCEGVFGCPTTATSGLTELQNKIYKNKCKSEENLRSHNHQCDIICCFPIWKIEKGNGNISSQDQLIGILHGLSFVSKFVPRAANIKYAKRSYNIREITDKIAWGINEQSRSCSNRIKYPGCTEPCDSEIIAVGDNTSYFYFGIAKTVSQITGKRMPTSQGNRNKWYLSHGSTTWLANLSKNHNSRFNSRMLFYLKLGFGDNFKCHQAKDVRSASLLNLPFEDYVLNQDNTLLDCFQKHNDDYVCELVYGMSVIGDDVPCYQIDDICNDSAVSEYGQISKRKVHDLDEVKIKWCAGGNALHNNGWDDPCKYTDPGLLSPIAYLHLLNLIIKSGYIPETHYINPKYVKIDDRNTYQIILDKLSNLSLWKYF